MDIYVSIAQSVVHSSEHSPTHRLLSYIRLQGSSDNVVRHADSICMYDAFDDSIGAGL